MELRQYQEEALASIYRYLRTKTGNPVAVLPTGSGKTPLLAMIASDVARRWNGRCLILAHVKELLEQAKDKIHKIDPGLDVGLYSAGLNRRDKENKVLIAGIQSVYNKACDLGRFDLIIVDEAHLIPPAGDGMYQKFLKEAKVVNPRIRLIGLTATPYRMSSGLICGAGNIFSEVCYKAEILDLIEQGYLSPLKTKDTYGKIDCSQLKIKHGEFDLSQMDSVFNTESNNYSHSREIIKKTEDRKSVLIFTSSVEHAKNIKSEIERISGEECGIVTGETPSAERATILSRFKREQKTVNLFNDIQKSLKYLVNVNVLTTGFDARNIDCVVILRATVSPGLYYQMVGRGLRIWPDKKDCLVLDYGGNIQRHGPIDDIKLRERFGKSHSGNTTKVCQKCQEIVSIACKVCPDCGYVFLTVQPEETQPEEKLTQNAEEHGILSNEVWDTEYNVKKVFYMKHVKQESLPGSPVTVRVIYQTDNNLTNEISEWVCPEHTGYARSRFVKWWRERTKEYDPPKESLFVVGAGEAGFLLEPSRILVRSEAGSRFKKIIKYLDFHERPKENEEAF